MPVAVAVASLTAVAGLLAVTTAVLANGDAAAAALTVSRTGRPPNVWRAGSRVGSAWRLTAACRPSGTWKGIRQCPA